MDPHVQPFWFLTPNPLKPFTGAPAGDEDTKRADDPLGDRYSRPSGEAPREERIFTAAEVIAALRQTRKDYREIPPSLISDKEQLTALCAVAEVGRYLNIIVDEYEAGQGVN